MADRIHRSKPFAGGIGIDAIQAGQPRLLGVQKSIVTECLRGNETRLGRQLINIGHIVGTKIALENDPRRIGLGQCAVVNVFGPCPSSNGLRQMG